MANARQVLAIKFNKKAARMLTEFVNMPLEPPVISRLVNKWQGLFELQWPGSLSDVPGAQRIVKSLWQGEKKGIEGFQIASSLGLEQPDYAEEGEAIIKPPFAVDIERGGLWLVPRDLHQLLWLTLLQHVRSLGICRNARGSGWSHPYFIRYRPEQKYCCEQCAAPAKREAKRQWWNRNRAK
jgi:hypothetical protein